MSRIEIKGAGCVIFATLSLIWLFIGTYAIGYKDGIKTAVNSLKCEKSLSTANVVEPNSIETFQQSEKNNEKDLDGK